MSSSISNSFSATSLPTSIILPIRFKCKSFGFLLFHSASSSLNASTSSLSSMLISRLVFRIFTSSLLSFSISSLRERTSSCKFCFSVRFLTHIQFAQSLDFFSVLSSPLTSGDWFWKVIDLSRY